MTKTVTANASRQARFAEKQRNAGKTKLTIWVSQMQAEEIKGWLNRKTAPGWPQLVGSEKQIAWANQIRGSHIIGLPVENRWRRGGSNETPQKERAIAHIKTITSAHWWIENRYYSISRLLEKVSEEMDASVITDKLIRSEAEEVLAEALLVPEGRKYLTVVEISMPSPQRIALHSDEYDESLSGVLRSIGGFGWKKPYWERETKNSITPIDDEVVELGVRLLSKGYAVRIFNEELRDRIIANDYQPMPERTIQASISPKYGKKFRLRWNSDNRDIQRAVQAIPKAKVFDDGAYVPAREYEAIRDMEDRFGFVLMPDAQTLFAEAEAKDLKNIGVQARPKRPVEIVTSLVHGEVSGEIDAELLDD